MSTLANKYVGQHGIHVFRFVFCLFVLCQLACISSANELHLLLVPGVLVPGQRCFLDSVRFASKKAGGSSKNVGGKSAGRRYGFKKQDGKLVLHLISLFIGCTFWDVVIAFACFFFYFHTQRFVKF